MARVLITGGSGFIGTNLVEECVRRGDAVLNLDAVEPRNPAHRGLWSPLDVCDGEALSAKLAQFRPEYVIHLAARTDLAGKSLADYDANVAGVRNLIAALHQSPPRRVLFASSMFVCRLGYIPQGPEEYCPHTVYGESKVAGEKLVRQWAGDAFTWAILRPTSIWGPWFDVPYKGFFLAVQRGLYFHPRGRTVKRSYGFVLNVVAEMLCLISPHVPNEAVHRKMFYLADYEPTDIRAWAELIGRVSGTRGARELPLPALRVAALLGDGLKLFGMANPPLTSFRLRNLMTEAVFDLSALRRLCGNLPYQLDQGVAMTVEWMRNHKPRLAP